MQKAMQDPEFTDQQMQSALQGAQAAPPALQQQLQSFFGELKKLQALGEDPEAPEAVQGGSFQPLQVTTAEIVRQRSGPVNAYSISFPQGIIWGILGCASGFSISLVIERRRGTLMRLRSGPINRFQVLAGKALACFVTILGVSVVLLLLARFVFGVHVDLPLLAMGTLAIALGFVGIMMVLSTLGRSEQASGGLGWAIMVVMAMLGGGMIPLVIMPDWMQTVSHVSPVKWAILAMEGALWRGFTFQEMLLPVTVLSAIGVACFTLGMLTFKEE